MAITPIQCLGKNKYDEAIIKEYEERIDSNLAWYYGRDKQKQVEVPLWAEPVNLKILVYLQSIYSDAGWNLKQIQREDATRTQFYYLILNPKESDY